MGLFEVPFVQGSDTSKDAADSIKPYLNELEGKVFGAIKAREKIGATCDEVELSTGLAHQTASARVRGLYLKGAIRDSGVRRPTRSGRKAIVWVAEKP